MSAASVFSIPAGVPFLPELTRALMAGELVGGFRPGGDPLSLADVTIYVPTRRAARELRSAFVDHFGGSSAILPMIRPLGEFEDDAWLTGGPALDLSPPIDALERIMRLAPLVQAWKRRLPAHLAALYGEDLVIPASLADAVWLARDLAALIDEVETEGGDWARLKDLVPAELAAWWQVTLEFLQIVTIHLPDYLDSVGRSNPARHRNALIRAEAGRLRQQPPKGPVIAAGSTGSIPATAELLAAICRLPNGAVVLPGLDRRIDARSWDAIGRADAPPSIHGHPQTALKKLIGRLGVSRDEIRDLAVAEPAIAARIALVGDALRPAETTEAWSDERADIAEALAKGGLDDVTLLEAANEREEALSIAVSLRMAIAKEGGTAALVTGDRDLARRVGVELRRFGIVADDSAGSPLSASPPATLMRLAVETALQPGDAVTLLSLLKHPLLHLGRDRAAVRQAAETIDLVALRGGTGRPDVAALAAVYRDRLAGHDMASRKPFWLARLGGARDEASSLADDLAGALQPLTDLRAREEVGLAEAVAATVRAIETLGREAGGSLSALYDGDAGERLAAFLRGLVAVESELVFPPAEWPDLLAALIASETVKPTPAGDPRISIWGTLEARLQNVGTLVIGGLNEGSWPRKAEPDRFMSRIMKAGLELEPPERRIGQAAHDFVMAMGNPRIVLTRSARAGEAPAVASRWLQRLTTCAGAEAAAAMRARGGRLIGWARALDERAPVKFARRPEPTPPVEARPKTFSVTEIETLRRDPYAIYARRVLRLMPVEPLLRDPGAAERGTLFHAVLHGFSVARIDPQSPDAVDRLLDIGRKEFDAAALPADVDAVWWPRFTKMAERFVEWERGRVGIKRRVAEAHAAATPIGATGATLSGYADRIDLRPAGMADIIDFKTGANPSKGQAHTLVAPQLPLEGALLMRGAFADVGTAAPAELAYVRLRANGAVDEDSILEFKREVKSAPDLSQEAWGRLEKLVAHYQRPEAGYKSRALPFREGDTSGDYDHLARVLEWSAGGEEAGGEE